MDTELAQLINTAGQLAVKGYSVHPARNKQPIPKDWQTKASNDLMEIIPLFNDSPGATQVGIACGPSKIIVIDIDMPDGEAQFQKLIATHGPLLKTLTQTTPSGGRHLIYNAPDVDFELSQRKLSSKVDVRIPGKGQIIYYGFDNENQARTDLNPCWVMRLSTKNSPFGLGALDSELSQLLETKDGGRNDQLNKSSFKIGQLVGQDLVTEDYARATLLITSATIGLVEEDGIDKCKATIESGISSGKLNPRESLTPRFTSSSDGFKIISYSEIEDEIVEWYEEGWIPKQGLLGLVGKQGIGKTTLVMSMLSQLTNEHDIEVAYLSTEGTPSRLKAQMRVHDINVKNVRTIFRESANGKLRRDLVITENMIRQLVDMFPNTRAIVVDPAVTFFDVDDDRASSKEVRDKLTEFDELATELKLLLIFIKHQKKEQVGTQSLSALDKMHGSGAWSQVPRICHAIMPLTDKLRGDDDLLQEPASHLLLNVKNNNYRTGGAKVMQMAEIYDEPTKSMIQVFRTLGIKQDITDSDIVEISSETRKDTEERVKSENWQRDWLLNYLKGHPNGVEPKVIQQAAKKENVAQATLYRRRKELIAEGKMEAIDGKWLLTDKGKNEGPPAM